jgi:hypothetical protein
MINLKNMTVSDKHGFHEFYNFLTLSHKKVYGFKIDKTKFLTGDGSN